MCAGALLQAPGKTKIFTVLRTPKVEPLVLIIIDLQKILPGYNHQLEAVGGHHGSAVWQSLKEFFKTAR